MDLQWGEEVREALVFLIIKPGGGCGRGNLPLLHEAQNITEMIVENL